MKLQTEKNTGLKSLADLKVIKRDGTETPFYAYKLNLIFKSLDADWATQQSVCQALSQAFKDQASATTVEIAETFVDGLRQAGHDDLATRYIEYRKQDEEAFAELLAQKTDKELLREQKHDEEELQKAIVRNETVSNLYEKLYEDTSPAR